MTTGDDAAATTEATDAAASTEAADTPAADATPAAEPAQAAAQAETETDSGAFLAKSTKKAYMDIQIAGKNAGRLTFALFGDVVPKTVDNFSHLC